MAVKLNGCLRDERGFILVTCLDDKARKLLPCDPSAEPLSFVELSKQLILRCGLEGQPSYFAALLQSESRRDGQSIYDLRSAVEEMAERAYPGMESDERRRVCLEPFINALTSEEQRRNTRLSRQKDLDEAEVTIKFESAHKTEARKKGTHPKEVKEIRAVMMNTGEDKTVKYIKPERKQTKGKVKSPQVKWRYKMDLSSKQPGTNVNMKPQMDAMMSEMAAMNAIIQYLAVGTNSVPSSQSRNW